MFGLSSCHARRKGTNPFPGVNSPSCNYTPRISIVARSEALLLRSVQEIDLNLLPILRVLLEEEHVSRAAERLHLSIPATSRALDRCRRTFNDPLLVRQGRGVVATPRARELVVQLTELLENLEVLRVPVPTFDPKVVRQTFVVRANEAVVAALGSALFVGFHAEAPHVEVRFESEATDDLRARC